MSDWLKTADGEETIREDSDAVICRLSEQVCALKVALKPLALYAKLHGDDHELVTPALGITLGDCRRAASLTTGTAGKSQS
jgi:hypothetical protein